MSEQHKTGFHHKKSEPFLIVGHGIAGALMAYELFKRDVPFQVIDEGKGFTSSKVSSGLINPITGRYFARSWLIDETLPKARDIYREIEKFTGTDLLKETQICRVLRSIAQENEWAAKMQRVTFGKYMDFWDGSPPLAFQDEDVRLVKISPVLQLRTSLMVDALKDTWESKGCYRKEVFSYDGLSFTEGKSVKYKDVEYRAVIFCEGHQMVKNPYFKDIPLEPTKGEVIIARIKNVNVSAIIKHHCFIVPWENDLFWIGSNYEKFPADEELNMEVQLDLENRLSRTIVNRFEVVHRWTGIRPASKDRRPIIGPHPAHSSLYLFNGLGTKGTVYAPYFASHLADHLINGVKLMKEVDLKRWN